MQKVTDQISVNKVKVFAGRIDSSSVILRISIAKNNVFSVPTRLMKKINMSLGCHNNMHITATLKIVS